MENKKIFIATTVFIWIGMFLRTYHLYFVGFSSPWNYGGLFLAFSRQIFTNHYFFPKIIPFYTQGGLPFAYPPIPFYFEAFLVFTLGLPQFLVVNLLPPLVSILSLFAFSFLVKKIFNNKYSQLFSIFVFSIFPLCFHEQIEASGLAESFGTLSIILLIFILWKYFQNPLRLKNIFAGSLIWAATVMASPGGAYLSIFIFIAFSAMLIMNTEKKLIRRVVSNTLLLALGAVIFSSLYWGIVIRNYGIGIFLNSFITQTDGRGEFAKLSLRIISDMTLARNEPVLFNALLIMTLCVLIYYKEYSLFFLTIATGIIPREYWVMGVVGVFVIGYALDLILVDMSSNNAGKFFPRNFSANLIIIFIVGLIISRSFYFFRDQDLSSYDINLDKEQIKFLESIKSINPSNADLIIVNGTSFIEWAPYLSQSTVLNVLYGTEFAPSKQWVGDITNSLDKCLALECINEIISAKFEGEGAVLVIIDLKNKTGFDHKWDSRSIYYDSISLYGNRFLYYYFKN